MVEESDKLSPWPRRTGFIPTAEIEEVRINNFMTIIFLYAYLRLGQVLRIFKNILGDK